MKISVASLEQWFGLAPSGCDTPVRSACIDSRKIRPNDVFFALNGKKVDGHQYVEQACQAGASACVVSRPVSSKVPLLQVPDVVEALQVCGRQYRQLYDQPVVAITGSCGKTTTKHFLYTILQRLGPAYATLGTLNNHLGVPLTLCGLRADYRYAVLEMGANHLGEIAQLADMVKPTHGLITMAGCAHLEGMGDIQGVAKAKGELVAALGSGATSILNRDDPYFDYWAALAPHCDCVTFGMSEHAHIRATNVCSLRAGLSFSLVVDGVSVDVNLPVMGQHNVYNALAAAAAAVALNVSLADIAAGLSVVDAVSGRLNAIEGYAGATIIDDTYNANPTSMQAAIHTLSACVGTKVLVVGDMMELGAAAKSQYKTLIDIINQANIDCIYAVGKYAQMMISGCNVPIKQMFDCQHALIAELKAQLHHDMIVLVKGSRGAKMEYVAQALTEKGT